MQQGYHEFFLNSHGFGKYGTIRSIKNNNLPKNAKMLSLYKIGSIRSDSAVLRKKVTIDNRHLYFIKHRLKAVHETNFQISNSKSKYFSVAVPNSKSL